MPSELIPRSFLSIAYSVDFVPLQHYLLIDFCIACSFTVLFRSCFESFMVVLRSSSRWIYPICRALAVALRIMATRMDTKLLKAGDAKAAVCRSNAAGLFRQCIADHLRDPEGSVLTSRSYLTLLMVNQCMRLFMQLATYKHCRSITLPSQPPLNSYPMSERVTYYPTIPAAV